jgi:hypothetical protein
MVSVKITKPSIPILFLDTCFFIDLVKNRHQKQKSPLLSDELRLADLVVRLTRERKLLCPEGSQGEEYELGTGYEDEIRREQVQLSFGISTRHWYGVRKYQTQGAMVAFIKGAKEVEYDQKYLFDRDPLKELEEQLSREFIVTAHVPMSKSYLDGKRKTKQELAAELESLRQEKIKMGVKYQDWVKHEILGELDVVSTTLKSALPKLVESQPITQDESSGLRILGDFLVWYSNYSGKDADIKDVSDFLRSDYYASIPYISVQSKLNASMITQPGTVRESDMFDFHQTSQMLPFSTYFLTDASLKHRITSKPLSLDSEYDVKVYSMKEIGELIKELEKL